MFCRLQAQLKRTKKAQDRPQTQVRREGKPGGGHGASSHTFRELRRCHIETFVVVAYTSHTTTMTHITIIQWTLCFKNGFCRSRTARRRRIASRRSRTSCASNWRRAVPSVGSTRRPPRSRRTSWRSCGPRRRSTRSVFYPQNHAFSSHPLSLLY